MTRPRLAAPRGVTLIELLVALGVSTLVVAAASALLLAQQRAHVAGSGQRAVQETARVALAEIGRNLRLAGYGVDPAMTLDFGPMDNVPRVALFGAGKGYMTSYACGAAVSCRDRTDGSDEIVFYARDPLFSRQVVAADANSVTVRGDLTEPLRPGQILQVMCLVDEQNVAYVTVGQYVTPAAVRNPAANVRVGLMGGQSGGALGLPAFPFENGTLAAPCFAKGPAAVVVTKIDRFRYYVDTYSEAGVVVAAQTPGSRPYLMLDQGLSDQNGAPIRSPVAPDVEDVQFAYLYPPAFAGGPSTVRGKDPGTTLAASGLTVSVPPPAVGDAPDAPSRRTGNPANILGVRVAVSVRTPDADIKLGDLRAVPEALNRATFDGLPSYRRAMFQTTILLKNLQGRGVIYPVVDPTGAIAGSLVGGG